MVNRQLSYRRQSDNGQANCLSTDLQPTNTQSKSIRSTSIRSTNGASASQYWRLLPHLPQMQQLMLQLLCECGISSQQLTQLRLKDIDWQSRQIHLYDASLSLIRSVAIPESIADQLKIQCMQIKSLFHADKKHGWVQVNLPQKVAHLSKALGQREEWQFVFPASRVANSYAASILRRTAMSCAALNNEFARAGRIARLKDVAARWQANNGESRIASVRRHSTFAVESQADDEQLINVSHIDQLDLFANAANA